jgi:hypothetical protein
MNPHMVPSQVASALAGGTQGLLHADVPQVAVLWLSAQVAFVPVPHW